MSDHCTKVLVNIRHLRKPYQNAAEPYLLEKNMDVDPFVQFNVWFENLKKHALQYEEINAVALSTCSDNKPSSRMVLLKEFSNEGFLFFTNSVSRKAYDFTTNPNASMLFYWPIVDRQVRVEGIIKALDPQVAEEYWRTRPLASRIGSKLSPQSSVIPSREFLEEIKFKLEKEAEVNGEAAIVKPETWLGYILCPNYFEFWQGQSNRIHDRLIYEVDKTDTKKWILKRLAP